MPHRTMQLRGSEPYYADVINLRAPIGTGCDSYGKIPTDQPFDIEEWNDWMRWENNDTEMNTPIISPPLLDSKYSSTSIISSIDDTWNTNNESAGTEGTSELYSTATKFPFGDAPFEINEIPQLPPPTSPTETIRIQLPPQDGPRPFHGYSSLALAEQRNLQDIAMPLHQNHNVAEAAAAGSPDTTIYSPITDSASPSASRAPSQSPPRSASPKVTTTSKPSTTKQAPRKNKKRKPVAYDDDEKLLSQSRKGHNAIEKRYRTNLNEKIECLRQGIPSLRQDFSTSPSTSKSSSSSSFQIDTNKRKNRCENRFSERENEMGNINAGQQQKFGKAIILTRALEYIKDLEGRTQKYEGEIEGLRMRVAAFEKLARSSSTLLNNDGGSNNGRDGGTVGQARR